MKKSKSLSQQAGKIDNLQQHPRHATLDPRHATLDMRPSTLDLRPSTCDPRPLTLDTRQLPKIGYFWPRRVVLK